MNNEMAINTYLSTMDSKNQKKQAEQKQNHRYGDNLEGYHLEGQRKKTGEKVQVLRSTLW